MDYTFNTLNDKEFELLVRDLFQKENGITLENFKSGKDKGIDLRYSESSDAELIIQCKHWLNSGISQLKYHLKNEELSKVKKLNPERYILATSLPLSPSDKDMILEIFKPYINKPSDIYSQETLNNLLGKFPEIEEKHHKLWLSSSKIIQNILNEYIRERSILYTEEIIEKIKKFVPTKSLERAQEILDNQKVLLITGEPGIGKTMLADFLAFKYLKEDFELTFIQNDLKDAEKVFSREKKQLFYFDDFLGRNYLEILSEKKFDSQIKHLVNVIRKSKNHFLILTSRTTIYNAAKYRSEYFDDEKFEATNIQLKLTDYNYKERGEILYNHLFFSDLDDKYHEEIRNNRFYLKIIHHKNFNPRIIEFITDNKRIDITKPDDYSHFIMDMLDDPKRIWEKAYYNEISDLGRYFLQTLFSFPLPVGESRFRIAFKARLEYESKKFGFNIPANFYNETLKSLLNGFIKRYINEYKYEDHQLDFINPSVADFFSHHLSTRNDDCERIIQPAQFYDQIRYRFISKQSALNKTFLYKEIESILVPLLVRDNPYKFSNHLNEIVEVFGIESTKTTILSLLPHHLELDTHSSNISIELFKKCSESPEIRKKLINSFDEYLSVLIKSIQDIDDLKNFKVYLENFKINTEEYFEENSREILKNLNKYLKEHLHDIDKAEIHLPKTYDQKGFKSELYWRVEDLLDEKVTELTEELETLGIDREEINELDLLYNYCPYPEDIVDEILSDMSETYKIKRSTHSTENVSYVEYLKNLFS